MQLATEITKAEAVAGSPISSPRSTSSGTSLTSSIAGVPVVEEVPEPPNEYLCPVAHELMSDPVILVETGQTYDRSSIERWFGLGQRRCPISGRELSNLNYVPNWSLKSLIAGWIKRYGAKLSRSWLPSAVAEKPTQLVQLLATIPASSVVSLLCPWTNNVPSSSASEEPIVPEGWTFFPGFDSTGNDISCSRFADSPESLAKEAESVNNCVAFNTNGFLKQQVIPKPDWVKWTSNPRKGLYIHNAYLPQVPGELPAIVPQPAAGGWTFFPCWDSNGGDMQHSEWRDVSWLMQYASQQLDCIAFNTNGWLKKHLKPPREWVKWTSNTTHGLYVRSSFLAALGLR